MGKAFIIPNVDFSASGLGQVHVPVPVQSLSITGDASIEGSGQYAVSYTPQNTTEIGVVWSIQSGSAYASIDQNGLVTALEGADSDTVIIRATSAYDSSIYAEKIITVTYSSEIVVYELHNHECDGTASTAIRTNIAPFSSAYPNGVKIEFAGIVRSATQIGKVYITCIDESGSPWPGFMLRASDNEQGKLQFSICSSAGVRENILPNVSVDDTFTGEVVITSEDYHIKLNGTSVAPSGAVSPPSNNWPLCIGGGPTSGGPDTWDDSRFAVVYFDYVKVTAL